MGLTSVSDFPLLFVVQFSKRDREGFFLSIQITVLFVLS